ncbi:hypothetical protein PILCRDRAFT_577819 [Piloderma croceum F 1598]|uniref:Uncharacterized protein n=1 Tax=Piloderma croceum (strain F 1598) TaxID=765440 RepID=A0A0C3FGB1_PILCF|nr:hypothetical protein PILCRDRAFT_577819 [Piloderma croceum F 1598]
MFRTLSSPRAFHDFSQRSEPWVFVSDILVNDLIVVSNMTLTATKSLFKLQTDNFYHPDT